MKDISQQISYGLAVFRNGENKKAKEIFLKLAKKDPYNSEIKNTLGVILKSLKEYKASKIVYQEAISLNPKKATTYANFSNLLKEMGDLKGALIQISNAIEFKNNESNFFNSKGIILEKMGKKNKAKTYYEIATKIDPDNDKAYNNLGVLHYKKKDYERSIEYFKLALEKNPNYYEVYSNIGATYNKLKDLDKAEYYLQKAIKYNPKNAGAYTNLGNVYNKKDNYKAAIKLHKKAIELDPKGVNAYSNLANSYKAIGRFSDAIKNYKIAIKLDPTFVNAKFDLSTTYLHIKDFENGWKWYESRFEKEEMRGHLIKHKDIFLSPRLKPDTDAKDKAVLIHAEQGFGDSIQFVRFVEEVKKRYKCKVILQCRDELKTLFENSIKNVDIFYKRDSDPIPKFDYQIPMLSLPYLFKIKNTDEIPHKKAYLFANHDKLIKLPQTDKIKIGICWGASVTGESYDGKVFDIKYFKPLIDEEKIEVVSLQVGEKVKDIKENGFSDDIIDISESLDSFNKTASLINQLDLVISSDTSVAHLAGALGKEVWIPLQKMPDWRWESKGNRSYWYDSATLFRQKSHKKWSSVFESIYAKLNRKYKLKIRFKEEDLCLV